MDLKKKVINTGCGAIDQALSSGITAGQWATIAPRASALTPSVTQAIVRHVEAEGQKVWLENKKGE